MGPWVSRCGTLGRVAELSYLFTDAEEPIALVIVDAQRGFDDASWWGVRDNPECEANIAALLAEWRKQRRPVVYVQHDSSAPESPLTPGQPGHGFKDFIDGNPDLLVHKSVNSSFHGAPDLDAWLESNSINAIVVCGITTNHCCETTARVGGNLGYQVYFALDATHTFNRAAPDGDNVPAEELTRITAVNLHGEFATVVRTTDLIA